MGRVRVKAQKCQGSIFMETFVYSGENFNDAQSNFIIWFTQNYLLLRSTAVSLESFVFDEFMEDASEGVF